MKVKSSEEIRDIAVAALDDLKGQDIKVLDVRGKSSIADFMVIATGTSSRQVKALADNVLEKVKEAGLTPLGVEGEDQSDWVLVDLVDVIVHVMTAQSRDFYQLEKLWA